MVLLLLWGKFFSQIIRDGMGRVVGLYPLLPSRMSVDRDDSDELVYTYTPTSDSNPKLKSGRSVKLWRQDVLHIPGLGFDGLMGYSPIAMARNAVGMTLACEEYGSAFFVSDARPGGVLEVDGLDGLFRFFLGQGYHRSSYGFLNFFSIYNHFPPYTNSS